MKKGKISLGIFVMVLAFGLSIVTCDNNGTTGQTMSDILSSVPYNESNWGNRDVRYWNLNPDSKEEIVDVFSNENGRIVVREVTRDWNMDQTVFDYVELIKLYSGTDFWPRFLRFSEANSSKLTEFLAFDTPNIGATMEQQWDEGVLRFEFLGQSRPPSLVFDQTPPFGRWMYPGVYKITHTTDPSRGNRYVHITAGSERVLSTASFTSWGQQ